jgi:hypothetical protein
MDEKVRAQGQMVMGAISVGISIPMGLLAAGTLLSYPDPIWFVGLLFAASFFLLFISGLFKILEVRKKEKGIAETIRAMRTASIASQYTPNITSTHVTPNTPTELPVLATWKFSSQEWKNFLGSERNLKLRESVLLLVLSTAVIAWLIHSGEGESWTFSIVFALMFSALIFGIKFFLSRHATSVSADREIVVRIDREKVLINDKLFYFRSDERWLEEVKIEVKKGIKMLELRYGWKTRFGSTNDSLFVPIPAGNSDVETLIQQIRQ